jgi:hypothetical protein
MSLILLSGEKNEKKLVAARMRSVAECFSVVLPKFG